MTRSTEESRKGTKNSDPNYIENDSEWMVVGRNYFAFVIIISVFIGVFTSGLLLILAWCFLSGFSR
jgi:hypothetical protein